MSYIFEKQIVHYLLYSQDSNENNCSVCVALVLTLSTVKTSKFMYLHFHRHHHHYDLVLFRPPICYCVFHAFQPFTRIDRSSSFLPQSLHWDLMRPCSHVERSTVLAFGLLATVLASSFC